MRDREGARGGASADTPGNWDGGALQGSLDKKWSAHSTFLDVFFLLGCFVFPHAFVLELSPRFVTLTINILPFMLFLFCFTRLEFFCLVYPPFEYFRRFVLFRFVFLHVDAWFVSLFIYRFRADSFCIFPCLRFERLPPYYVDCRGLDRSTIDFVDVRGVYYCFKTKIVPGYVPGMQDIPAFAKLRIIYTTFFCFFYFFFFSFPEKRLFHIYFFYARRL